MKNKSFQTLTFVLSLLLVVVVAAKANPVDIRQAREVGAKFISANTAMRTASDHDLQWVTTYRTTNDDAAFHVFNTPKGFVIVSADDCATPILGYSEEGHFGMDNVPPQMEEYLQGFVEQIQYGIDNHLVADETVARQWELVQSTGLISEQRGTTAVQPLLTDTWNQNYPYNYFCPLDSDGPGGHVYAGCVATSFSQIMHFWGYPTTGTGSHTYTPEGYPQQTANFGATTYQWSNMPNSISSSSPTSQIEAVATLMWHCGVAVDMMYGPDGSGAYSEDVASALVNYFNYSDELSGIYKDNYSNAQWLILIKGSLDVGRPVHYSGHGSGGHAFVCDGYDNNDYLHFNWGWGGAYNNYFALDALTPGNHNYSNSNFAIINIHPNCNAGTTYQVTASAYPSNGGTVSGGGNYGCGTVCTLTATPANGYMFCSWTEGGAVVSTEPTYSFTVMGARNLVANFYQNSGDECTLVFNLEDSFGDGWNGNALTVSYSAGCVSSEELTFESGSSATFTRNVVDGSHIVLGWISGNWTEECSFTVSYESGDIIYQGSNLSSDFSYEFDVDCNGTTPTYYTITTASNPTNGGTTTGGGSYAQGSTCTISATPANGYMFCSWTEGGEMVSTEPTYSFTVMGARNLVANFYQNSGNECTLVFDLVDSYGDGWNGNALTVSYSAGCVSSEELTIESGSSATFTRSVVDGSHIVLGWISGNWTNECSFTVSYESGTVIYEGSNLSSSFSYEFDVDCNGTTPTYYTITTASNPTEGGTTTGGGTYQQDSNCTLVATAATDYVFSNWTKNGQVVSTSPTYSFVVTENAAFVANFEQNSITQTTNFAEGWTWWSTYIDADDILTQLTNGLGENGLTIKSKTQSRIYWNGSWQGALTAITDEASYRVQTSAASVVDITGSAADPVEHPITLTPGWTWIGYPLNESMTTIEALANITPSNGDVIKSKIKTSLYRNGAWMNGFTITPGMGLMYKSNSSANVTLVFPTIAKGSVAEEETLDYHWMPNALAYPGNMTVVATIELDGIELQGENYELAAFSADDCRGSSQLIPVDNRYMAVLTIAGDENAELHFGLYNTETGEECFSSETLNYETDVIVGDLDVPYIVRFRSTGLEEWTNAIHVYPNPVNRSETISLGLAEGTGKVQVEILNALGMVVETLRATSVQNVKAPDAAGVYTLRITVEGEGTCYKKLIVR